jgi:glycosyltransferase involved in cell wall biosynthesis
VVEESHLRVILEAAVNGIPTIANRIGGVSEALGDSGILIDYNEQMDISAISEKYVVEISRLLDDNLFYAKYRRKALVRAESYMQMQGQQADEIYSRYFS